LVMGRKVIQKVIGALLVILGAVLYLTTC
jgi:hypothetical protein